MADAGPALQAQREASGFESQHTSHHQPLCLVTHRPSALFGLNLFLPGAQLQLCLSLPRPSVVVLLCLCWSHCQCVNPDVSSCAGHWDIPSSTLPLVLHSPLLVPLTSGEQEEETHEMEQCCPHRVGTDGKGL